MKTSILHSSELLETGILKPNFHLNVGKLRMQALIKKGKQTNTIHKLVNSVYSGGIFKRVFVETSEHGIPYISAQDMMTINPRAQAKLISKKFTPRQNDMTLRENQILISCAGTVGNVRLVTGDLDGIIGSQDIIRVIPKEDDFGFIYAYLSSETCNEYIQSLIYGSVVPRIEPKAIAHIPVPFFPKEIKEQIHDLIAQSAKLRVEANKMFEKIIMDIESKYAISSKEQFYKVHIKNVIQGDKFTKESRLEADFYQPQAENLIKEIKKQEWTFLGDISNEIYCSGLRERRFVKVGIPLITGQNLNLNKLSDLKMLSRKFTRNIEKNTTKESDILISVLGTIGKIEYCYNNIYQGVFASQQITKVSVKRELIHPGYIYAFLKSKLGQIQLQKHKTGSVIEWIIENNIASVVVPVPSDKGLDIGRNVDKLTLMRHEAYNFEISAIKLIETEITKWQQ